MGNSISSAGSARIGQALCRSVFINHLSKPPTGKAPPHPGRGF
jgi:hypothetical protein